MKQKLSRDQICPYCKSRNTAWKGYRTRANDKVRLRRCRECKRKYTTRQVVSLKGRPKKSKASK